MKKYQIRQEKLLTSWDFDCFCELCQQESVNNDDEIYEEFSKLQQDVETIKAEGGKNIIYPESYLKLTSLYREMYKLAKGKKTSKTFMVFKILELGFNSALSGYLEAKVKKDLENKEIFKKECDTFSSAAVLISELALPDEDLRVWKQRKDDLDNWVKESRYRKIANYWNSVQM